MVSTKLGNVAGPVAVLEVGVLETAVVCGVARDGVDPDVRDGDVASVVMVVVVVVTGPAVVLALDGGTIEPRAPPVSPISGGAVTSPPDPDVTPSVGVTYTVVRTVVTGPDPAPSAPARPGSAAMAATTAAVSRTTVPAASAAVRPRTV
jgi:hypothetical protein